MSESARANPIAVDAMIVDGVPATPDDSVKRDSEVWFEDGNIVVIAQNTAFRFHKSVLSLHSSVFSDLFSIPQPSPAGEETLDGCPVVHVSDTSYDFRELLRAIYGGVSHLHPEKAVTFAVLAALARLSHKYQLDQLLAAVLHRLKGTFTTQLDVWDRSGGFGSLTPLNLRSTDAIEALNLFRLLDRPEMIPVALYECSQIKPGFLLRGAFRSDGVTREHLSPSDMELCMEARDDLVQATALLLMRLCEASEARILQVSNNNQNAGCLSPRTCMENLRIVTERGHRDLRECIFADPLCTYYTSTAESMPLTGEICGACGDVLRAAYSQERRTLWRSLPKLAGVEVAGWDSA